MSPTQIPQNLVLASSSPRRRQLLSDAGLPYVVRVVPIPEERVLGEQPTAFVQRLAREKAFAVPCAPGEIILGADTAVALDDHVLGKPQSPSHAHEMLRLLSGRDHWVYTGICLRSQERVVQDFAATRVTFCSLTEAEFHEYVLSGEPMDKAGAYAIQGLASKFVSSIQGSYSNVVGLPICLVYHYLKTFP